jgi:hypothetical protein
MSLSLGLIGQVLHHSFLMSLAVTVVYFRLFLMPFDLPYLPGTDEYLGLVVCRRY